MKLYAYQQKGAEFLAARERGYNADDCGLGKTAQATAALGMTQATRTLVISPASAIPGWHRHAREMSPPGYFEVASYDKVRMEPSRWLEGDWSHVILDEAHYLKTHDAARTKAALDVARRVKRVWLLSATPMPNHAGELWPIFAVLFPGVVRSLGIRNRWQWEMTFTRGKIDQWGQRKVIGSRNPEKLLPFLRRIMLRRTWESVGLDLPPLRIDVEPLPQNLGFSRALAGMGLDPEEVLASIEREDGGDGSVSRLRRLIGTYKAPLLAHRLYVELEEKQYEKLVLLAHHHDTLDIFQQILSPFGVVRVDGSTATGVRGERVQQFGTEGGPRVFLGQQGATGTGTDGLQVAHEIVLAEPSWVPDENYQAVKRVHRIGSDAPCRARLPYIEGTLDEAIINVAARKARDKAGFGL